MAESLHAPQPDSLQSSLPPPPTIDSPFDLKQAVERLREGLFDPVAVRLLTAHETQLKQSFDSVIKKTDASQANHLMICGDYGQGKSHSLAYIRDKALREGFAVSRVNLDIREIPMHNFRQVYRALITDLSFPCKESSTVGKESSTVVKEKQPSSSLNQCWRQWAKEQFSQQNFQQVQDVLDFLPETMPHLFRCALTAMTQKNMVLDQRQKTLKKHAQFRPREYPDLLNLALSGEMVPVARLRHALKYRQVPGYTKKPLSNKGNLPYLQMIKSLGCLIQKMGYRGWILLFDEAESISQLRVMARAQSYQLLQQLIFPDTSGSEALSEGKAFSQKKALSAPKVLPVFALTDDFFERLRQEDYDKTRIRNELEIPYFSQNYADALKNLNIFRLQDLPTKEWGALITKLIRLYCQAYHWETNQSKLQSLLVNYLQSIKNKETRLKIKALINELDLEYQESLWQKT